MIRIMLIALGVITVIRIIMLCVLCANKKTMSGY